MRVFLKYGVFMRKQLFIVFMVASIGSGLCAMQKADMKLKGACKTIRKSINKKTLGKTKQEQDVYAEKYDEFFAGYEKIIGMLEKAQSQESSFPRLAEQAAEELARLNDLLQEHDVFDDTVEPEILDGKIKRLQTSIDDALAAQKKWARHLAYMEPAEIQEEQQELKKQAAVAQEQEPEIQKPVQEQLITQPAEQLEKQPEKQPAKKQGSWVQVLKNKRYVIVAAVVIVAGVAAYYQQKQKRKKQKEDADFAASSFKSNKLSLTA